jgi:phthalate 4,5-dioxygenase oxygenase subunit
VYGRNEDCGLRCLYHGCKVDVKGNVVETVSEPATNEMTKKVKHRAYQRKKWGGFVWAYMGPQDAIPEFVPPPWAPTADVRVSTAKAVLPCNWAQVLEGALEQFSPRGN